jgi:hypothetical protein
MAMDLVPPFGACVNQLGVGLKIKRIRIRIDRVEIPFAKIQSIVINFLLLVIIP